MHHTGGAAAVDDRIEQVPLVDERELRRVPVNADRPPGVVEAAGGRPLDTAHLPELLRGGLLLAAQDRALHRAQSLAELDPAQVFERLSDHVAVDAGAQARARAEQ